MEFRDEEEKYLFYLDMSVLVTLLCEQGLLQIASLQQPLF